MKYSFGFTYMLIRGRVEVFPAGAYVQWNGQGFHIEHVGPEMGRAIFEARIAFKR